MSYETQHEAYEELKDYFATRSDKLNALWAAATRSIREDTKLTPDDLHAVTRSHRYGAFLHTLKTRTPLRWTVREIDGVTTYQFRIEKSDQIPLSLLR